MHAVKSTTMKRVILSLPFAYGLVVLIWGTTPLSVQWSAQGFSPFLAALVRVLIAFVILVGCVAVAKIKVPMNAAAYKVYAAAVLGQGVAMLLIYWSAMFLSSGLVSLIFGFSPLITGFLAWYWYREKLSLVQTIAVCAAIVGLVVVFSDSLQHSANAWDVNNILALVFMLLACLFFCISNIWVRRFDEGLEIHPLALTIASLVFAMPLYFAAVFLDLFYGDQDLADLHISGKAVLSTAYLAILGSVIAPYYYFIVLKKGSANLVALITVITPVIALVLGALLNAELVGYQIIVGAAIILVSLLMYQFSENFMALPFIRKIVTRSDSENSNREIKAKAETLL